MTDANFTIKARQLVLNIADFDGSAAGEALIAADPALALKIIMDQAKALRDARFSEALKTGTSY
jgi:hypothetical protein